MDAESLNALVAARAAQLAYYSPYNFLPQFPGGRQQELFGTGAALGWSHQAGAEICRSDGYADADVRWLMQRLPWDSDYFGTPIFRLFTGLFGVSTTMAELTHAATALRRQLEAREGAYYAFGVIPAEDVQLVQGLSAAGWRVVETRLTYYRDQLATLDLPRYPVRAAVRAEAAHLGRIVAAARNPYDRVHADAWFGEHRADAYLAQYAVNAVTAGLAATVLVPHADDLPVDSFLAISDLETDATALGTCLSRVLLTAVGPANRGWHVKLLSETLHRARALSHEAVLMTTQATNRAVVRNCEKLGFRLGATSLVLACHNG
ncbi:MAG TPA: hypothetical protein VF630_17245 [Hymenobacter sp.]|jgi:dTDP-4-amino-4,6-dideoxy-D-galactose acyltransferase